MEKPLKTYNYKMNTKTAVENYEDFQCLAVFLGMTFHEAMGKLIADFVRDHYPIGKKLVNETEALKRLSVSKSNNNRSKLAGWRKKDVLKDAEGRFWYTNNDGAVVYDWDKLAIFTKIRQDDPYKRFNEFDTSMNLTMTPEIERLSEEEVEVKPESETLSEIKSGIESINPHSILKDLKF